MSIDACEPKSADPAGDYRAAARALGPLLEAAAEEIERRRELTEPVLAAAAGSGLFHLLLPRELGGAELPPAPYVEIIAEVARHDASTAWCLGQANGCAMTAAFLDPAVAREIFASPRGVVAWGPLGPAELAAVPGGYRLSGRWGFASGSRHAHWLGAHVAVVEADGTPRRRPDGGMVLRTLLFPKASAHITDNWRVVGLSGTGSDTYAVADLFVPERYTVLRDPAAKPRQGGALYCFGASNLYSCGFAGVALGIARRVFEAFVELAGDKVPRGARHLLREDHVVQSEVARAEARLSASRAYLLGSLARIWREVSRAGRLTPEHSLTIRLASTWAIHQSRDVVERLYYAAGADAIFAGSPFERRFRDIHAVAQQYQGRQAHFETVGQVLLGSPAEGIMFTF
ncbi:MAG TPA: acyl-CoA dehydrogenase family protein [Stellaceae bacterium]|nr:acyl-CoA dehydrogenase family protein [Stellaceae bacterium]